MSLVIATLLFLWILFISAAKNSNDAQRRIDMQTEVNNEYEFINTMVDLKIEESCKDLWANNTDLDNVKNFKSEIAEIFSHFSNMAGKESYLDDYLHIVRNQTCIMCYLCINRGILYSRYSDAIPPLFDTERYTYVPDDKYVKFDDKSRAEYFAWVNGKMREFKRPYRLRSNMGGGDDLFAWYKVDENEQPVAKIGLPYLRRY